MQPDELLPPPTADADPVLVWPGNEDAPPIRSVPGGRVRVDRPADLPPGVTPGLLVPVGPWGSVGAVVDQLDGLAVGWIVVLSTEPSNDAGLERAVAHLAAYGYHVDEVADLDQDPWRSGVRLLPTTVDGEPAELSAGARAELQRRRTHQDAGRGASPEVLRRRLRAAERARSRETERAARFETELREATRELDLERWRRDRLERSTSYRLGQAVVQGVRDPSRLPSATRELARRWRRRERATGRTAPDRPSTPAPTPTAPRPSTLTVARLAAPQPTRTVAGIVTDRTAAGLADEVALTRLTPHDAVALVAATEPAVVLVESEACRDGEVWAGAGSGAVPGRDTALAAVLDAADRVGAATVLVWSGERWRTPGLAALAGRCTLEVAADEDGFDVVLGVPASRVHAERTPGDPDPRPASLELRGPRRLIPPGEDVVRYRGRLGGPEVVTPWGLWSRHATWWVPTDGPDRWHRDAATIAGVAWRPADGAPADAVPPGTAAPGWADRVEAVTRGGLHASLVALGELLGRDLVPATSRSVALVLARPDARAVDHALHQRHLPPGSALVVPAGLEDRARGVAEAAGLRVTRHLPADVRFVVPVDADRHGPQHLATLLAGWELARTPVVGLGPDAAAPTVARELDPRDALVQRDHAAEHGLPGAELPGTTPATTVPTLDGEVGP